MYALPLLKLIYLSKHFIYSYLFFLHMNIDIDIYIYMCVCVRACVPVVSFFPLLSLPHRCRNALFANCCRACMSPHQFLGVVSLHSIGFQTFQDCLLIRWNMHFNAEE